MTYIETRRCISIPCGNESTIEVEGDTPPGPTAIDDALHAIGWREGFCPDCTKLGPKQTT